MPRGLLMWEFTEEDHDGAIKIADAPSGQTAPAGRWEPAFRNDPGWIEVGAR
jgi:hypothetical protein